MWAVDLTPCGKVKGGFAAARRADAAISLITPADSEYPAALRTIFDPPSPLYVRGKILPCDAIAVAIVGARRATEYGKAVAQWLARQLAQSGVTVVSGLARGVDAAAHRGALEAGGRTIAVLGCGPDIIYPPEHRSLMAEVIGQGAVVSEFAPGTPPHGGQFPQRNRIISGLSLGVVVVEGREDSGALITADAALEQGREVFAVPGRIFDATTRAPHRLLQEGAKLVQRVEDILQELHLPVRAALTPAAAAPLDPVEGAVYRHLSLTPQHIDHLAAACGLPIAATSRALTALECKGLAVALPGNRYVQRPPGGDQQAQSTTDRSP